MVIVERVGASREKFRRKRWCRLVLGAKKVGISIEKEVKKGKCGIEMWKGWAVERGEMKK